MEASKIVNKVDETEKDEEIQKVEDVKEITFWLSNINHKVNNNEFLVKKEKTSDNDIKMVVDEEEFLCPICYGEFEFNHVIYIPDCKCKLMFHRGCIKESMDLGNKECPQCRGQILGLYKYLSEPYNKKVHLSLFCKNQNNLFNPVNLTLISNYFVHFNIGLPKMKYEELLSIDNFIGCPDEISQIQDINEKYYQNALHCYKLIFDKLKNEYNNFSFLNDETSHTFSIFKNIKCWGIKKNGEQCTHTAKYKLTYTFLNDKKMTIHSCGVHCKKRNDGLCHSHFITCEETLNTILQPSNEQEDDELKIIDLPTD